MNKQSLKVAILATPLMIVCGLLGSGVSAVAAGSDDQHCSCSNKTLSGDYGSAVEGLILPAPGVALPIRGVVMSHNDGDGNFTQVDHIVFNGTPPDMEWTPGTGTYHVNADCTGTAHIVTSTGGFVNLVFVLVKQGKEMHSVVTAPFDGPPRTVTSVAIRIGESPR
jgi:hypothetical protein